MLNYNGWQYLLWGMKISLFFLCQFPDEGELTSGSCPQGNLCKRASSNTDESERRSSINTQLRWLQVSGVLGITLWFRHIALLHLICNKEWKLLFNWKRLTLYNVIFSFYEWSFKNQSDVPCAASFESLQRLSLLETIFSLWFK